MCTETIHTVAAEDRVCIVSPVEAHVASKSEANVQHGSRCHRELHVNMIRSQRVSFPQRHHGCSGNVLSHTETCVEGSGLGDLLCQSSANHSCGIRSLHHCNMPSPEKLARTGRIRGASNAEAIFDCYAFVEFVDFHAECVGSSLNSMTSFFSISRSRLLRLSASTSRVRGLH